MLFAVALTIASGSGALSRADHTAPSTRTAVASLAERLAEYETDAATTLTKITRAKDDAARLSAVTSAYESFSERRSKDGSDFLAASFAGLTGAWRCRFAADLTQLPGYVSEAGQLLDQAVTLARGAGHPGSLRATLRNRVEIFTAIPAVFGKHAAALADAEELLKLVSDQAVEPTEEARTKLLNVRALAVNGKKTEARDALAKVKAFLSQQKLTLAYELDEAEAALGP